MYFSGHFQVNFQDISETPKKSVNNCFISELWTWVTLYMYVQAT